LIEREIRVSEATFVSELVKLMTGPRKYDQSTQKRKTILWIELKAPGILLRSQKVAMQRFCCFEENKRQNYTEPDISW